MSRKPPRFEALVVNAIRRLQAAQGSTATEIANYLSQEYDVSGPDVRKLIQLTIRRGVNYGILQKSKRGFVTCDRHVPTAVEPMDMPVDCFECKRRSRSHGRGRRGLKGRGKKRGRSRGRKGRSRGRGAKRRGRRHGARKSLGARSKLRKARSMLGRRKASSRRRADAAKSKQRSVAERVQRKRSKKTIEGDEQTAHRPANSPVRTRSTSKSPMRPSNKDDKQQEM